MILEQMMNARMRPLKWSAGGSDRLGPVAL